MLVLEYLMKKSLIFRDISYFDYKLEHKLFLIFTQLKKIRNCINTQYRCFKNNNI